MKELFVTAGYQMAVSPAIADIAGGVIMPSHVSYHALSHRTLEKRHPYLRRRLLDPQMYLAELNAASCRKPCARLASYGWFPLTGEHAFDSSEEKPSEWLRTLSQNIETAWEARLPAQGQERDDAIRQCLLLQHQLRVEAFILPAPLTQDLDSDYSEELEWLESGVSLGQEIAPDVPVFATIALSDVVLRGPDPWSNPLLNIVLDQVTARGVAGAYVVPVMSSEDSYYFTHPHTVGALLRLCNGLKAGGVQRLIVSFAGTAGLLCLAAGADAWVTGWFKSQRRMRLSDFEREQGRVVPAYYSHPLGGEFHMDTDLDRAVESGFLDRIADVTPESEGLLRALRAGRHVRSVPAWRHQPGNRKASIDHFLTVSARETALRTRLSDDDLRAMTAAWLEAAYGLSADLQWIGPFNPRTAMNHQFGWRGAFERFSKERY
jgi:hypothetical protein